MTASMFTAATKWALCTQWSKPVRATRITPITTVPTFTLTRGHICVAFTSAVTEYMAAIECDHACVPHVRRCIPLCVYLQPSCTCFTTTTLIISSNKRLHSCIQYLCKRGYIGEATARVGENGVVQHFPFLLSRNSHSGEVTQQCFLLCMKRRVHCLIACVNHSIPLLEEGSDGGIDHVRTRISLLLHCIKLGRDGRHACSEACIQCIHITYACGCGRGRCYLHRVQSGSDSGVDVKCASAHIRQLIVNEGGEVRIRRREQCLPLSYHFDDVGFDHPYPL
mmetsp:Transcript_32086/g.83529  ORF Transcript_32086/g.83529 Transcript_32086/m.83529 type:complete len:280 (+) Transcript_32086:1022-1861(+)